MKTVTPALGLILREAGALMPMNDWAAQANEELQAIENAIVEVCTPQQIARIRELLQGAARGVFINRS